MGQQIFPSPDWRWAQPHLQCVEQPFPAGKFAGCMALPPPPPPVAPRLRKGTAIPLLFLSVTYMACYEVTFIHFYLHHADVGFAECHHVLLNWTLAMIFSQV